MKRCGLLMAFAALVSCTVAFPQLETLTSYVGQVGAERQDQSTVPDVYWTADLNGRGRLMRLYSIDEGGFVFASEEGDLIGFDGWVIRSIIGFGLDTTLRILGDAESRRYVSEDEVFSDKCSDWRRESSDEFDGWRQICKQGLSDNIIVIDKEGDVDRIVQTINQLGDQVVLERR